MTALLNALKATAEPTRLRLVALCAECELTETELTGILAQSQPRLSRHLKVLCEADVFDRFREGIWVFFRLAREGRGAELGRFVVDRLAADDPTFALDRQRLADVRRARAAAAAAYYRANAAHWDDIRKLSVPEADVERALLALFANEAAPIFVSALQWTWAVAWNGKHAWPGAKFKPAPTS